MPPHGSHEQFTAHHDAAPGEDGIEQRTERDIPLATTERREQERPPIEFGGTSSEKPGRTEKGQPNEDKVLMDHTHRLYGVFDGMGGHAGGAIAANLAAEHLQKEFPKALQELSSKDRQNPDRVGAILVDTLQKASARIREEAKQNPLLEGMGTTAALVHLLEHADPTKLPEAIIAHAADSRVYRLRGGKLERLTKDQSLLQAFIDAGTHPPEIDQIGDPDAEATLRAKGYTDAKMKEILNIRNIVTGGLGDVGEQGAAPDIGLARVPVEPGDEFVIISDGVGDPLTDRQMQEIAAKHTGKPSEMGEALIAAARDVQGIRRKLDDASAVVVRVNGPAREAPPPSPVEDATKRHLELPVIEAPPSSPPPAAEWSGTTGERPSLVAAVREMAAGILVKPKELLSWVRAALAAEREDAPDAATTKPPAEKLFDDTAYVAHLLDQRTEQWRTQTPDALSQTAEIYRKVLRTFETTSIVSPGQISDIGDRRAMYRAAQRRWEKNPKDADAVATMDQIAKSDAEFKRAALERLRNVMVEQSAAEDAPAPPVERPPTPAPEEAALRAHPELRAVDAVDARPEPSHLNPAQLEYWGSASEAQLQAEVAQHEQVLATAATEGRYTLTGWVDPRGILKNAPTEFKLAIARQDMQLRREAIAAIRTELQNRAARPASPPEPRFERRTLDDEVRGEIDALNASQLEQLSRRYESDLTWHDASGTKESTDIRQHLTSAHGIQRKFDLVMRDNTLPPDQRAARVQEILNQDKALKKTALRVIDAKLDAIESSAEAA
ncbi:protein phosphatase 2C domain-containing protein [Candidatus Uhrbacteria bacterium]|nr:protein phosphatase 2C domain-containing protein [Candidatus Uhrbacteria bacterium]